MPCFRTITVKPDINESIPLVSGGSEDFPARWIALNHAVAVNDFLDCKNRVAMTNRPDPSPNPESNEQAFAFLESVFGPVSHSIPAKYKVKAP